MGATKMRGRKEWLKTGGVEVLKISRRKIKKNITVYSSNPPDNSIDVSLLKKLKVKRTKNVWVAEIPKSENIKNIKTIKNNLSLLFKESRDGDIDTIQRVVSGEIFNIRSGVKNSALIQTYKTAIENKIFNIDCGIIKGKTAALKDIVTNYQIAYPSHKIYILVPTIVGYNDFNGMKSINLIENVRHLRSINKEFKGQPEKAVLFSDNIKNAPKKLTGLGNIIYRGGFYGTNGINL